jgi:hypothetical protein
MEALGVLLDVLCFGILWVPVGLIALVGGLIGLVASRRRNATIWIVSLCAVGVGACMLSIFVRNRFFPEYPPKPTYNLMDEQVKPFVPAIERANPSSLGFTLIPADAKITIYEDESPDCPRELFYYIVPFMPEIGNHYAYQSICFQKNGDAYLWVGEFEYHVSLGETLDIRYGTVAERYHHPSTHSVIITYVGKDPRLQKPNLTLEEVRPILVEWEARRQTPKP